MRRTAKQATKLRNTQKKPPSPATSSVLFLFYFFVERTKKKRALELWFGLERGRMEGDQLPSKAPSVFFSLRLSFPARGTSHTPVLLPTAFFSMSVSTCLLLSGRLSQSGKKRKERQKANSEEKRGGPAATAIPVLHTLPTFTLAHTHTPSRIQMSQAAQVADRSP